MSLLGRHLSFCLAIVLACTLVAPLHAASIELVNNDPAGMGFNDPTPVSPVPGNSATTLGGQRLAVFQAAADAWAVSIDSTTTIRIGITMPVLECDAFSAILGGAGATLAFRDFPNAPRPDTWYSSALADALTNTDLAPGEVDVVAEFNDALDNQPGCLGDAGWWYGIQSPVPGNQVDFFTTVLHEITHGLGFSSFVDPTTGRKFLDRDDAYMVHLRDASLGQNWPTMTDAQRAASAIDTGDLVWTGPNVTAELDQFNAGVHSSGRLQMYAPAPFEGGSSVSHFDIEVAPNELMEPFITADASDLVATDLLQDIGWPISEGSSGPCVETATRLCLGQDERFAIEVSWRDFQNQTGVGTALPFARDSGLFWFFGASNLELLVKVLDGCGVNQNFWVFFAATTNVEFTVTVTDTQTGLTRSYSNPLGQAANAVTDIGAFSTCPSSVVWPDTQLRGPAARSTDLRQRIGNDELAERVEREREHLTGLLASARGELQASGRESQPAAASGSTSRVRPLGDVARTQIRRIGNGSGLQTIHGNASTPDGSTYEPFLGEGFFDGGQTSAFSLYQNDNNLAVTFDDRTESQSPLLDGTVIRVRESFEVRPSGTSADLNVTLFSRNGEDVFPDGFVGNGTPLTDGIVAIGFFLGADALDFDNTGVLSASITTRRNNQLQFTEELDPAVFFGSGAWDGSLAVSFPDLVGQGIDTVEIDIRVGIEGEDPPVEPFTCVPDAQTLCLNGGRFQVTLDWRDFQSQTGPGNAVTIPNINDSGLMWFFDANNIELLVKVLDGCALNQNYWVFFAATTNVEFDVTVTDSDTGQVRRYSNPLGQPADAVTDTTAFATCP